MTIDDIEKDPSEVLTTQSFQFQIRSLRNRNWFARNFRPVSNGGLRSSIFTLMSGTIGAGVQSLPAVASYFGLITSCILVALFGCLTIKSYLCLNEAILDSKKRGYANLCAAYFGKKGGKMAVLVFTFTQFMACVIYSVLAWNFIQAFITDYNLAEFPTKVSGDGFVIIDPYSTKNFLYRVCTLVPQALIMLPVFLSRKLSGQRYFTFASFIIIFYTIAVAIVESPFYYKKFQNDKRYNLSIFIRPFEIHWLQGISTISMSFICHPIFFNIRREFVEKSEKRIRKVIYISIIAEILIYIAIIIAGQVSLGDHMQVAVFTQRPPLHKDDWDVWMKIAQGAFIIVILTCIPVNMYPCREQIKSFWKLEDNCKNHVILTVSIVFSAITIAILYPDVLGQFGIFGGLCSASVGLIIPFMIKVRLIDRQSKKIINEMSEITKVKVMCCYNVKYDKMRVSPLKIKLMNDLKTEYRTLFRHKCCYGFVITMVIAIGLGSQYVSFFDSNQ